MAWSDCEAWTSHGVSDTMVPRHAWGDLYEDHIRLVDTGTDAWPHALVAPDTFWFFYPRIPSPDAPREQMLVRYIELCMRLRPFPLKVLLFSRRTRVESYGMWTAVELQRVGDACMLLTLHRNAVQPAMKKQVEHKSRPYHVSVHEHHIRRNVPPGWTLCHEERDRPSVVHGRRRHDDAVRCDMVLTRGCRRVCIVSLASRSHLTTDQRKRCEYLRDRMLCRVILVAGMPPDLQWLDFGHSDDGLDEPIPYDDMRWIETMDDDDERV